MKAVFLTGIRRVELRDVPEPGIRRDDDVLLRVDTVGVCGSDMHYYRNGRIGRQVVKFPWIIGHECAGTVLEVGPTVVNVSPGDRVAVDPLVTCGECDQCRIGRPHTCRNQLFMGVPGQLAGSLVERVVMPASCCYRVPETMTVDQAVLIEPFAIGLYASRRPGRLDGMNVAVLGSGPIGLCVLASLKAAGASAVYVTDLLDNRLELAGRFGAEWFGNAGREDVVAAIYEQCPLGMDVVFECVGKQETLDQAGELLRPGGTLVIVGIPVEDRVSFDMNHFRRKELTVLNVRRQNHCIRDAIEMVAERKVDLDALITHHLALEEAGRAFDLAADYKDGAVKVMIRVA